MSFEFRLKPPFTFPFGRAPRINRAHPLFNNQHMVHCAVAQGVTNVNGQASMVDLISGVVSTNTTTLGGVDNFGPYVWSNDAAGTATLTLSSINPITSNFTCWSCIMRLSATNRQYFWAVNTNTGFWNNGANINFELANGSQGNFNGINGHVYFLLMTNAPATASQQRTMVAVDLSAGGVIAYMAENTASGNITSPQTVTCLGVSSGICTNRIYASFMTISALTPPAGNPAATFYSIDQIMSGLTNPWALFYA